MQQRRILVLGGTGFVGRALCALAAQRSEACLVVPTRRLSHGQQLRALPNVELEQADVHDEALLTRLLQGCDAAVNLVGVLHGSESHFQHVHVELPRKLARACHHAGVRRVVHVSALGAAPDAPSRYLRSKAGGETVLHNAALDLTILRPSVLFGEEDRLLNLFARLQRLFPVLPLGGAHARFQPVWVHDVADAILRCLERPQTIDQIVECAGPQVCTLAELVKAAGRWAGHERPVIALPDALARLQALALQLLPGEPLMSSDNLESMKRDSVATGAHPGLETLGIRPSSMAAIAPSYLAAHQGCARLDAWRARARRA